MVSITNISVSVDQKSIVKGLNLEIKPGTIHALMGPNGSGKSTLAYALMGHPRYSVDEGAITYKGQDLQGLSADKRATLGIFLAFQHPLEIPGVNVLTFLKEAHYACTGLQLSVTEFNQLVQEKLALLSLDSAFLQRNLNEGFSGGEKKRLEMLQMLVLNPSLVILDEIDSGLDIDALKIVGTALMHARQANPALSVIVITHYQRILEYIQPDWVHIFVDGCIQKSGDASLARQLDHKGYHGTIAN